jgi:hypothetical protein
VASPRGERSEADHITAIDVPHKAKKEKLLNKSMDQSEDDFPFWFFLVAGDSCSFLTRLRSI